MATPPKACELRMLDLASLQESPHNPRSSFDRAALKELAASVKEHGILTPLLVRKVGKKFEILAGHRRYRAAKAAGLNEVPVTVRDFADDNSALEAQIVENLQRQDVHPMDEGAGYRYLIDEKTYDLLTVAIRVGKSQTYVAQRLVLTNLIAKARRLFREGAFGVECAMQIARLPRKAQAEVLVSIQERSGYGAALTAEILRELIARQILCDLGKAPFSKRESELVKGAPSCVDCQKRTGYNKTLFADLDKKDRCLDRGCFLAKTEAFFERAEATLGAETGCRIVRISESYSGADGVLGTRQYSRKNAACPSQVVGLYADGSHVGQHVGICLDERCKTCHPPVDRTRQSVKPAEAKKAREKRKKEIRAARIELATRLKMAELLSQKLLTTPVNGTALLLCAEQMLGYKGLNESLAKMLGLQGGFYRRDREKIQGWSDNQLGALAVLVALTSELVYDPLGQVPEAGFLYALFDQYGCGDIGELRNAAAVEHDARRSQGRSQEPLQEPSHQGDDLADTRRSAA